MHSGMNSDIVGNAGSRSTSLRSGRRRGITSAIAMIFMVLIGALALGFYATITTSTSVAQNDLKGARALVAAESGIQFMRYQLAHVKLPPLTTPDQVLNELYIDLKANLESTGNLGTNTIGFANNTITIPAQTGQMITTDTADKSGFTVTITRVSPTADGIVCKIIGHSGNTTRAHRAKSVTLDFVRQQIPSSVLSNAVAAQGKVTIQKGLIGGSGVPDTIASILSTKATNPAVQMTGGTLGGDIGTVATGLAAISGGSVHGTTNLTTIYNNYVKVATPPEFPTVDTTPFAAYATNAFVAGSSPYKNVRIPANSGTAASPLVLAGNVEVQGIMYIESPNVVQFGGNATLAGMLVFENKGTSATNSVTFTGNATVTPMPPDAMFNAVRSITGIAILAPTAKVTTTGSTDSYFKGNVIVGTFNELGSATIKMDAGSIVTMDTGNSATFNGMNTRFMSTGILNPPSLGVKYSSKFIPDDGTYQEMN
jgi:Tfp pilus assembly protein PilX